MKHNYNFMKYLNLIGVFLFIPYILLSLSACSPDTKDEIREIPVPNPLPDYNVSISMLNVAMEDAPLRVSFTPTQGTSVVKFQIGTADDLSSFVDDSSGDILTHEGDTTFIYEFEDLVAEKDYMIFAKAVDEDGESYSTATTLFNVYKNDDFTVNRYYVSNVSAGFRMDLSSKYCKIRYAFGSADDLTAFENNTLTGSVTIEEPYTYWIANTFDLTAETDYVFYCVATDIQNNSTPVYQLRFKTDPSTGMPDAVFTLENDVYTGTYTITPNEFCGKAIIAVSEKDIYLGIINGKYNFAGDYATALKNWDGNNFIPTSKGTIGANPASTTVTTTQCSVDVALDVLISIYDKDGNLYGVKYYEVQTPAYDETAGKAVVGVEIKDITANGATYEFSPNSNTLGYLYETYDKDYLETALSNIENGLAGKYSIHDELVSLGFWQYMGRTVTPFTETACASGTEYYVVIAPMNANGIGLGWGDLIYKKYQTL